MSNKIGALIIDLESKEVSAEERELLAHPLVGGVILFTRNYESRHQLSQLCKTIRASRKTPLLIMVDQEGGRVQRFIPEFTRLSPMALFGHLQDKSEAMQLAGDCGWLMAIELLSAGIDMSLAPILDLNKGISSVIGDRAFHADPQLVIEFANAWIHGMKEAGMAATGKHFPGHGSVEPDSHVAMPIDQRTLDDIQQDDLVPFVALIKHHIPALMAAHIVYPTIDDRAVSYSPIWLQTILRQQLGFKGAILSDDLHMQGANISPNYADRVIAARDAGCDFALICNQRSGVIQVLNEVDATKHQVDESTWKPLQGVFSTTQQTYADNHRWQATRERLLNLSI